MMLNHRPYSSYYPPQKRQQQSLSLHRTHAIIPIIITLILLSLSCVSASLEVPERQQQQQQQQQQQPPPPSATTANTPNMTITTTSIAPSSNTSSQNFNVGPRDNNNEGQENGPLSCSPFFQPLEDNGDPEPPPRDGRYVLEPDPNVVAKTKYGNPTRYREGMLDNGLDCPSALCDLSETIVASFPRILNNGTIPESLLNLEFDKDTQNYLVGVGFLSVG